MEQGKNNKLRLWTLRLLTGVGLLYFAIVAYDESRSLLKSLEVAFMLYSFFWMGEMHQEVVKALADCDKKDSEGD